MDNSPSNRVAEERATFNFEGATKLSSRAAPAEPKQYRAKIFKSGNSLALRLPAALGLEAGMEMELTVGADGGYALTKIAPPRQKIDISGFWGKAKGLRVPERRDFDERPSTIAARLANGEA